MEWPKMDQQTLCPLRETQWGQAYRGREYDHWIGRSNLHCPWCVVACPPKHHLNDPNVLKANAEYEAAKGDLSVLLQRAGFGPPLNPAATVKQLIQLMNDLETT